MREDLVWISAAIWSDAPVTDWGWLVLCKDSQGRGVTCKRGLRVDAVSKWKEPYKEEPSPVLPLGRLLQPSRPLEGPGDPGEGWVVPPLPCLPYSPPFAVLPSWCTFCSLLSQSLPSHWTGPINRSGVLCGLYVNVPLASRTVLGTGE